MRSSSRNVLSCTPLRPIVPGLIFVAAIASVGACSSTPSASEDSSVPDAESAYTKDAAADAKHDGASADASLPDGGASACGNTSSSPTNCGACGHSCLGSACKSGLCAPEIVARMPEPWQKIRQLAVQGQKLVVSAYATPNLSENFFVGSTIPGTVPSAVPDSWIEQPAHLRISGPFIYYFSGAQNLCWRPLAGGAEECIPGYGQLTDEDVDGSRVALSYSSHDGVQLGTPGQTTTVPLSMPVSGAVGTIALAGDAVLAMLLSTREIYSLPMDGSPGSVVGTAPAAEDHNSCLVATGSHVFGRRYSTDYDCSAAGYAIWGGPKAGPMNVIVQGKGLMSCPAADADVLAYEHAACSAGADDEIYSVPHGGKPRLVARMPYIRDFALAGSYVYFAVDEKVYRVAK